MDNEHKTVTDIVAEARDKYTVHNCDECDYRKCCENRFGDKECDAMRRSISLALGIEDGYFSDLLSRIEEAYKRDMSQGNAAAMREALLSVRKAIDHRGGDLARYTLPVIDAALKTPPEPAGDAAMVRMALEVLWDVIGQFSNKVLDGQTQLVLSDMLIPAKNAYHHALAAPVRKGEQH